MEKQKFYLTTAITYTSGKPHIGNTYEIVLADLIARAKRMQGYDVYFMTGTDEHGEKIELKAKAANKSPKQFVDEVAAQVKSIWDMMGATYDKFMRTTDADHEAQVQKIFEKLYKQGDIYKGSYKGHYCTPCESFWTDSQLKDGKCPDCGREVQMAEEEAYFFAMSKYSDKLQAYYDEHPEFITPVSRKNEMVNNFLKPGLQDLCVSRTSFTWGVPVSFDPKHVVYVWLDALTNYITGVGYDCDGNGSELYNKEWPADLHIIGKDIVRFHVIYWPIFLMALGVPLPKQVYGHPWLLQDGGKMSKSKGNVIYADDLVNEFGVDAVRYYLLGQMPFENDGTISWDSVIDVINSELVNVYGNLVQRTVAMSNKYFGGEVRDMGVCEPVDEELKSVVCGLKKRVFENIDSFHVADALGEIVSVVRRANKYIDETVPWILAKDESKKDRLHTVLYNLTETIVICSSLLEPFMPTTAKRAVESCGATLRAYEDLDKFGLLGEVKVESNPAHLFARLDADKVKASLIQKGIISKQDEAEQAPASVKQEKKEDKKEEKKVENIVDINEITIDDFAKVQLRVGEIISAEKVEKADKLLKFSVKIGEEVRTIVSGIAKFYTPEEMLGKRVVVVYNLKPAKLRGIESQGMLLCACEQTADGEKVVLVAPEKPVSSGSTVR
ncbi:MAG: methionine--tRNA ligase [Clostridiales bacterium]|nr:methionine--tRNA ligase [Clostridiales bacterium]